MFGFAYCQKQKGVLCASMDMPATDFFFFFFRLAKQNLRFKCAHVMILMTAKYVLVTAARRL